MIVNTCARMEIYHANGTMLVSKEKSYRVLSPMLLELVKTEFLVCRESTVTLLTGKGINIGRRNTFSVMCIFRHFKIGKRRRKVLLEGLSVSAWAILNYGFDA